MLTIETLDAVRLTTLNGKCYVVDGDTIKVAKKSIRLFGIDAPEMDDPYGNSAKWALIKLTKGKEVTVRLTQDKSYDRLVGRCYLSDGTDLSAEMVKLGMALDWAKYSEGEYRHLEPAGIRKKLWRVTVKQGKKVAQPVQVDETVSHEGMADNASSVEED